MSLLQDTPAKGREDTPARRVVLHVITGLRTGGAEKMLCGLLSVMNRRHWDPVVISLTDGSEPEAWLREQGIPVYCLGMQPGRIPSPALFVRLIRLVRRIRPDLIHGWMYHANLAAGLAAYFLRSGTPVIWSIHHSTGALAAEKKMTIGVIRLGASLCGMSDSIVYASQTSREQHKVLGYRDQKACIIPNGVDPAVFAPSPEERAAVRRELGISSSDIVIGLLARYHPVKDHANFLRAASRVSVRYPEHPGIQFILAGAHVDADNQDLKSLINELGLTGRVHLLGERGDTNRLLAAMDLFGLSSRGEALPVVLLEAMSCAVPCVTTDVGDAGLLVGDTGRVVSAGDPEALAGAWEELITAGSEIRKSLGGAAREKILRQYTLSACGQAYENLYMTLLR